MTRMKMNDIRELSMEELESRLQELRSELTKIRSSASTKMLKKDTGKIRPMRRDIARMMTYMTELRREK